MDRIRLLEIIIWVLALAIAFAVLTVLGWKVFYGYVVPQANNTAAFSVLGLFAFAALAGFVINFGPCSLAILPAYVSFYLGMETNGERSPAGGRGANRAVAQGIKMGAVASLGVVGFYVVLGLLFATIGTFLAGYSVHLRLTIAGIVFALGVLLLRGGSIELGFISRFRNSVAQASRGRTQLVSLVGFGVVYGAGGLSCLLPVFLPLVFYPFVGGRFFESLAGFTIFALSQALFLIGATVLAALGKMAILKGMIGRSETIKKAAGAVLILTSFYMVGVFIFLRM